VTSEKEFLGTVCTPFCNNLAVDQIVLYWASCQSRRWFYSTHTIQHGVHSRMIVMKNREWT